MQENGRRNNIQKCCRMNDRNGIVSEIVKWGVGGGEIKGKMSLTYTNGQRFAQS
jgi:hypothetical protein